MKNLKKAIAALSLLMCLFLMCSCMRMETGVIINGDGTGRIFSEVTVSEKILEDSQMSKDEFMESITKSQDSNKYADWNKEDVERTIPGETGDEIYVGVRYYKDGNLKELMNNGDDDSTELNYDMRSEDGKITVTIRLVNSEDGSIGGEAGQYISQGMMKVYFTITAPTEIIESNGTISEDKRTATWDILSIATGADKEKTLTITFSENSPFILMLIIMGGVLAAAAIAGVVMVALSKRKYKPRRGSEVQSAAAPVPTEQSFTTQPVQPIPQPVEAPEAQVQAEAPAEETASVQSEAEQKFCINCGAKLEYEAAFCMNCGEQIKK